ncbi:hypothetical protein ACFPYI_12085 [Halomarina salina]|uniref:Uncharacterized protein n=1 Tax=Halomarina salina TaxID=1872699 RepID=A0ABD5RPE6_9EURY|nr:hypothetical protein [Halomarina salina]
MGLLFENPEEELQDLTTDILALDENERFTSSLELVHERLLGEDGDIETIQAIAPNVNPERIQRLMDVVLGEINQGLYGLIDSHRNAEIPTALLAAFVALAAGIDELDSDALSDDNEEQVLSSMVALFCRLQRLVDADETSDESVRILIHDVGATLYYVDKALDDESDFPSPSETDFETLRASVLEFGAAVAYANMPISIGRGAELADCSRFEFESVLEDLDIEVRRGPSSVEELHNDGTGILNE